MRRACHVHKECLCDPGRSHVQLLGTHLLFLCLIWFHADVTLNLPLSWGQISISEELFLIGIAIIVGQSDNISGEIGLGRHQVPLAMNSETFQSLGAPRSFRILSPYNWNILFPFTQGSYHILVLVPEEIAYEMCLISQFLAFKIPFQAEEWYVLVEISQIDSFERYLAETHCDHKEHLFCKRSHNCCTRHAWFQSLVWNMAIMCWLPSSQWHNHKR